MKSRVVLLGILCIALQGASFCETPSPAVMERLQRHFAYLIKQNQPYREPEILAGEKVELEVVRSYGEKTSFDMEDSGTPEAVDVIHYLEKEAGKEDLIAGPTVILPRNQLKKVMLENHLKAAEQPKLSFQDGCNPGNPVDIWKVDGAMDLFGTNLHTHGLHVSPNYPHDFVFLDLAPGKQQELTYQLAKDHPAGTFWYHAHRHGAVAYQLVNGMAGALIVPGQPKDKKNKPSSMDDLEAIPEIVAANDIPGLTGKIGRVMLIQQFRFTKTTRNNPEGKPVWVVDPGDISDRKQAAAADNTETIAAQMEGVKKEDILATNGIRAPVIQFRKGCVERWRMIHAGIESAIDAQWFKWTGTELVPATDKKLTMYEIALDGIPTGHRDQIDTLTLRPGYRSDLLVRLDASAKVGDIYVLQTQQTTRFNAARAAAHKIPLAPGEIPPDQVPADAIAIVEVSGESVDMKLPEESDFARWKIETPIQPTVRQTIAFHLQDANPNAGGVPDGQSGQFGVKVGDQPAKPYAETNGAEAIHLKVGQAEEWTLSTDSKEHPFHIHVNPFQVQDPRFKEANGEMRWVWRDTLLITAGADPVKIRMLPKDFAGKSVLHCHILDHEDQGMMKNIEIAATAGQGPDEKNTLNFFKPAPKKNTVPLNQIVTADGRPNVLVVFAGLDCGHCVVNLRAIARCAAAIPGAKIVAASATPLPANPEAVAGLPQGSRFSFSSAPLPNNTLKKLGLIQADGTVRHAVLIFNSRGKEVFRYTGDQPLPDPEEIRVTLEKVNGNQ